METTAARVRRRRTIRDLEQEELLKTERRLNDLLGKDGMWPLNAPGMPEPGPNFLRTAIAMGDAADSYVKASKGGTGAYTPGARLRQLYRQALRTPGFTLTIETRKGAPRETVSFVPGHIWGQYAKEWEQSLGDIRVSAKAVDGPHPATVMVLGKMPWKEEVTEGRNMVSATGEILRDSLVRLHVTDAASWYVTNLVKFCPPEGMTVLKAGWIADCLPLLHQELRIVRPKYILCLGADASKALLGKQYGVGYMEGRVVELRYPVHASEDSEPEHHTALVMTVLHPAEVARSPDKSRILERGLARFALLRSGVRFDLEETGLDHRVIDNLEDAQDLCAEIDAYMAGWNQKEKLIAWDAEWQGQHPVNPGSYVRTIQIAWDDKKAACFKITHVGGKLAFRDREGKVAVKRLAKLLNEFMGDKRAVGHFLVSDLEWLRSMGIDPTKSCPVPVEPTNKQVAWERLRDGEGWFDTAFMCHAIEETAALGLESLAMRYTTCPRYDIPLEDWKKTYCKERGISTAGLEGYGECPDEILHPYALYDADATLRIARAILPLLDSDYEGNCAWEPFWESMLTTRWVLRMHENGILADRALIDDHTKKFITARAAQEEKIQSWAKWPEFNIRSVQQVREFLFGERFNGKISEDGRPVRIRPLDGRCLRLTPLLDTSKPPRRWDELVERGLTAGASPGTNKMILGILAQENINVSEQVNWIRDYRFLDQVLKSVLREPSVDENDRWIENENGELEYEAGLAAAIDADGRVRTHIYPTAETGRCRHARPNLANLSKSRDPDYERMLGKDVYKRKIRSILKASPGYALIEFDYIGAELELTAIMSGSSRMLEHCQRAKLSESDPNYYDIHSNIAVMAFRLQCPPTKSGLKSIGKSHFRTLAKNVIFGMLYGRGAKAIALQAREQGISVTPDDAQQVIDTVFQIYPELVPFFESAKSRAIEHKWLSNCFGRRRRFPTASDYKLEGEFERQAMNFPIQSGVASCVDRGLAWLEHELTKQDLHDEIRLLLQMHDAGLVEARYDMVPYAVKLIRWAMVDQVPIYPTDLAGVPRGDGPYYLGLDFSIEKAWSEKYSTEELQELGINLETAA